MPDEPRPGPLLLDTHVWIWMMEGEKGVLADSAMEAIREASRTGGVLVAAISVWEVGMLEVKGRLTLSRAVEDWVDRGLAAPGTRFAKLTPEIAIESTRLPGDVHGDPADRLLIATARRTGARLATRDRAILSYAQAGHVNVLDATP